MLLPSHTAFPESCFCLTLQLTNMFYVCCVFLTVLLLQLPADSPAPHACTVLAGAGPLNVRGSLSGSHIAPNTRVDWAAPGSGVTGSAQFSTSALAVAVTGEQFSLRASAAVTNPTLEQARTANTQVGPGLLWGACSAAPICCLLGCHNGFSVELVVVEGGCSLCVHPSVPPAPCMIAPDRPQAHMPAAAAAAHRLRRHTMAPPGWRLSSWRAA
jgi:hypothetical protein